MGRLQCLLKQCSLLRQHGTCRLMLARICAGPACMQLPLSEKSHQYHQPACPSPHSYSSPAHSAGTRCPEIGNSVCADGTGLSTAAVKGIIAACVIGFVILIALLWFAFDLVHSQHKVCFWTVCKVRIKAYRHGMESSPGYVDPGSMPLPGHLGRIGSCIHPYSTLRMSVPLAKEITLFTLESLHAHLATGRLAVGPSF